MPTFYSPSGNPEVWAEKPENYLTPEEWQELNPPPEMPEVEIDVNPAPTIESRLAALEELELARLLEG